MMSPMHSLLCFFAMSSLPVLVSKTMKPPPKKPAAMNFPSGEYAADRTFELTFLTAICLRWYISYTRSVLSSPALTNWGRNGCVVRPHSSLV